MTLINKDKMKREVYCFKCNRYSFTDELAPRCTICKSLLYNVLYDKLTGRRTGDDK